MNNIIGLVGLGFICFVGGAAISAGYFAFISLVGIFPKLMEKIKWKRHYLLVECCLAYGAAVFNAIYIFNIHIRTGFLGVGTYCLLGGIFVGCLSGALAEVLNVYPIISRRSGIRNNMPYLIYCLALGKLLGSMLGLLAGGLL